MSLTKVSYSMIEGAVVNVIDYGADNTGTNDSAAAIRLALDYAGSLTRGATVLFPEGTYKVLSTVFIPTTTGIVLRGENAILEGQGAGTGTILETGREAYSTGGTTNWTGGNETFPHYYQTIQGLTFKNCYYGLKLWNFIQGCLVQNNSTSSGVTTLMYLQRCFYCGVLNNAAIDCYNVSGTAITEACFIFGGANNVMNIQGNSATRITSLKRGSGYFFTGGTDGLMFANNSAESGQRGLLLRSEYNGVIIQGCYMEGNDRDIQIDDGNPKNDLTIQNCWMTSSDVLLAETWISGEFKNNRLESAGSIDASDTLNSFTILVADGATDEVSAYTDPTVPANYTLANSVKVRTNTTTYLNSTGPTAARSVMASTFAGSRMIASRNYVGASALYYAQTEGGVPFCDVDTSTVNTEAAITTKIEYEAEDCGVRFDFVITDNSGTYRISGWISGLTVFRNDAETQTVTVSNASGYIKLTIGAFSAVSGIVVRGGVRIV